MTYAPLDWVFEVPRLADVRLEGDTICARVGEVEPAKSFLAYFGRKGSPKGHVPPHIEFARLKRTPDDSAAINFHRKYGALKVLSSPPGHYRIPVEEFWSEQRLFHFLVKLLSFLQGNRRNDRDLRTLLEGPVAIWDNACIAAGVLYPFVVAPDPRKGWQGEVPETKEGLLSWIKSMPRGQLWKLGEYFICAMVNEHLEEGRVRLLPPRIGDFFAVRPTLIEPRGSFLVQPMPGDLLESFYVMLANDAMNNSELAICRDPLCMKPFVKERRNKLYCDETCTNRAMVRRHYHRQRKKGRRRTPN